MEVKGGFLGIGSRPSMDPETGTYAYGSYSGTNKKLAFLDYGKGSKCYKCQSEELPMVAIFLDGCLIGYRCEQCYYESWLEVS